MKKIHALLACAVSLGIFNGVLDAQSSLVLSSGTGSPGATVPLNLTLTSTAGNLPAAIQWSLGYSTGVASVSVVAGPVLTAASKSITCGANTTGMICVAVGTNANTIANGVAATINVTLTANATSAAVAVGNTFGASPAGQNIATSGIGATITTTGNTPPVITSVAASGITTSSATITWSTNQTSNSQVSYGPTSSYGSVSGATGTMVTSHSVGLTGLNPSTTYHYQAQSTDAQGAEASSTDLTFTTGAQQTGTLLEVQMNPGEANGTKNGSVVTPTIGPSGFTGATVVNGSGSVSYSSVQNGNGAYFLTCCSNTNNAYYQFPGTTVGNIFNMSQGQVSFTLQSRYSFAQRTASASAARYAFDVQDGNQQHPFYFYTTVTSGHLAFEYAAAGSAQYYYVPAGTENTLFGNGVALQVTMSWGAGTLGLYLNGTLVKSTSYTAGTANWTASTIFTLGGRQYQTFGGYDSSDDAIAGFMVTAGQTAQPQVTTTSPVTGATVAGLVGVTANASDSVSLTQVQFQLDGANLGSAVSGSGPAYGLNWDTTTAANGTHTLTAVATDANGKTGVSGGVSVTVNNPPPVISAVTAGSIGSSSATISWTTDQLATSLVVYGLTNSYGMTTVPNLALVASHSVNLTGLTASTTYHFQVISLNVKGLSTSSADYTFQTAAQPTGTLLELQMNSGEVSGTKNGSIVTPTIRPSGFTGAVVVNGSGSVNPLLVENGNGVYFLNCCGNTNNAYYQFVGTAVGSIFNLSQGQVSFALKSRYSFAQRSASASAARYAFDVQDGSGLHPFYFYTDVASGRLEFEYAAGGSTQYYFVPAGTENTLFGSGVVLQVTIGWGAGTLNLYLNNTLVKSTSYTAGKANWTASTALTLGGRQYLTFGGYDSLDDAIAGFTVMQAGGSGAQPSVRRQSTASTAPGVNQVAPAAGSAVSPSKPVALSCSPGYATAGQSVICETILDQASSGNGTRILVSSDNPSVRVPASVSARRGQTTIRFQAEIASSNVQTTAVISARAGLSAVQTNLTLSPSRGATLTVPGKQTARPKSTVQFRVTAADADDMPLTASALNLPIGSTFDPGSGVFEWEPTESDSGEHNITFSTAGAKNSRITKTATVYVDSGQPAIETLQNGANKGAAAVCSPGAVATLTGHSLYAGETPQADYSGRSMELDGTRVAVNGEFVPVLYSSAERVSFLCPAGLPAGSALQIRVQTEEGSSNTLASAVAESAPGIFTANSSEGSKALAFAESGELSQIPTPETAGLPILPKSGLVLLATGIPCNPSSAGQLLAKIEQQYVTIQSVRPAVQHAGVCEISIEAPDISGDALAIVLEALGSDGQTKISNTATVSIANY